MSLVTKIEFIDDPKGKSHLKGLDIDLHYYLTDQADWDAEYWDFDSEYLQDYAKMLEDLFSKSKNGIEFQAMWIGEQPDKFVEVSINEFLEIVRSNKIGTSTRYIVNKNV
ncbi:MAG: hypothetical protein HUJ22_03405 [Gracilimonas sp.]|uniref:hypothetical protein n=1 Tax=Gracilimonas sp. TaxID=1974203 RepID=UPI001988E079|nr:hypothetical protein [Gracilimonas sp.]MBD3615595.1 hypothetical protein [Gracilimonas sp.]